MEQLNELLPVLQANIVPIAFGIVGVTLALTVVKSIFKWGVTIGIIALVGMKLAGLW